VTGEVIDFAVVGFVQANLDEKRFAHPQVFPVTVYLVITNSSLVVLKRSAVEMYSEEHFDRTLEGAACAANHFKDMAEERMGRYGQRRLAEILFRSLDNAPFSIC